jgi:hypothetical protein
MLRGVQETHKKMQTQLHQEEKDLAKGKKKCTLTAEVDFLYCPWVLSAECNKSATIDERICDRDGEPFL